MISLTPVIKLIPWLTAILITLIPVVLAVTDNMQQPDRLFDLSNFMRYQSELLFLSISINAATIFDAVELIKTATHALPRLLFVFGLCVLIINLVSSAIIFGSLQKAAGTSPLYLFSTLSIMILTASLIKYSLYKTTPAKCI